MHAYLSPNASMELVIVESWLKITAYFMVDYVDEIRIRIRIERCISFILDKSIQIEVTLLYVYIYTSIYI